MRTGWIIRLESLGNYGIICPCGNSGAQATHYKRFSNIIAQAQNFKKQEHGGECYFITDAQWSQKVCEMSPKQFADYVMKNGKKVA